MVKKMKQLNKFMSMSKNEDSFSNVSYAYDETCVKNYIEHYFTKNNTKEWEFNIKNKHSSHKVLRKAKIVMKREGISYFNFKKNNLW